MRVSTLFLPLCLTISSAMFVEAQNHSREEFVLPIKLYGQHLTIVQGGLGGLTEQNLVIDTGSYPSAIDVEVARKLKLKVNRGRGRALGQNIAAGATVIPQVEIGPIQAKEFPVVVEDLSGLSTQLGIRVDGLIGLDVLARKSFQVDYDTREMDFGDPVHYSLAAPLESRNAMGCVAFTIDGHLLHLLVDTGAAKTVLFAPRVPWLTKNETLPVSYKSLAGAMTLNTVKAKAVDLNGTSIAPQDIFVSETRNMDVFPFDGVLATRGAHFARVSFDFEHDLLTWDIEPAQTPRRREVPTLNAMANSAEDVPTVSASGGADTDAHRDSMALDNLESH